MGCASVSIAAISSWQMGSGDNEGNAGILAPAAIYNAW